MHLWDPHGINAIQLYVVWQDSYVHTSFSGSYNGSLNGAESTKLPAVLGSEAAVVERAITPITLKEEMKGIQILALVL